MDSQTIIRRLERDKVGWVYLALFDASIFEYTDIASTRESKYK